MKIFAWFDKRFYSNGSILMKHKVSHCMCKDKENGSDTVKVLLSEKIFCSIAFIVASAMYFCHIRFDRGVSFFQDIRRSL